MQCEGSPAHANTFANQFLKKLPSRNIIRTSAHLQIRTLNIHLARPCAFHSAKGLVGCRVRVVLHTPIDLPINSQRNSRLESQSAHPHIRKSTHPHIRTLNIHLARPAHANRFTNQFLKKLPSPKIIRTSTNPHIIHSPRSPLCIPLSQRPRRMQSEGSPAHAMRLTN